MAFVNIGEEKRQSWEEKRGIMKKKFFLQNLVYIHNKMLHNLKNEKNLDTCYNVDEP